MFFAFIISFDRITDEDIQGVSKSSREKSAALCRDIWIGQVGDAVPHILRHGYDSKLGQLKQADTYFSLKRDSRMQLKRAICEQEPQFMNEQARS